MLNKKFKSFGGFTFNFKKNLKLQCFTSISKYNIKPHFKKLHKNNFNQFFALKLILEIRFKLIFFLFKH